MGFDRNILKDLPIEEQREVIKIMNTPGYKGSVLDARKVAKALVNNKKMFGSDIKPTDMNETKIMDALNEKQSAFTPKETSNEFIRGLENTYNYLTPEDNSPKDTRMNPVSRDIANIIWPKNNISNTTTDPYLGEQSKVPISPTQFEAFDPTQITAETQKAYNNQNNKPSVQDAIVAATAPKAAAPRASAFTPYYAPLSKANYATVDPLNLTGNRNGMNPLNIFDGNPIFSGNRFSGGEVPNTGGRMLIDKKFNDVLSGF